MKKLLTVLFILFAFVSFGQKIDSANFWRTQGYNTPMTAKLYGAKFIIVDSGLSVHKEAFFYDSLYLKSRAFAEVSPGSHDSSTQVPNTAWVLREIKRLKDSIIIGGDSTIRDQISSIDCIIIDSLAPYRYRLRFDSACLAKYVDSSKISNDSVYFRKNNVWVFQYKITSGGGGGITAITGDVSASGTGSVAATLATVNSSPGSYTNANITVNGKGLITAASSAAVPPRYLFSATAPTDTTVGWIDSRYNFLQCYPIHFRVNGVWSDLDTLGGPMYDFIGRVFSRGKPFVILVVGQSNPAGPYWDDNHISSPSLYAYQGDTIPCRAVGAYNFVTHSWGVAQIRTSPFASASGANYVLVSANKIHEYTGKSVRILMQYRGGTALDCWAGAPGQAIDTSLSCYKELIQRMDSSGIPKPDLMIWGQSEAGASVPDSFYRRYKLLIDTLRRTKRIDTTKTLVLGMASGNIDQYPLLAGTGADNALRQTNYDNDYATKYIEGIYETSDGIHWPPLAHEHFGLKIFNSWKEGPVNPINTMTGYDIFSTKPSPYSFVSDDRKLMAVGLNFTNKYGFSYMKFGNGLTMFVDADSSLLGKYAGIIAERNVGNGTITFKDYAGYNLSSQSDGNLRAQFNLFYVLGALRSQSINPMIQLYNPNAGAMWQAANDNGANHLIWTYNSVQKYAQSLGGNVVIGTTDPEKYGNAKLAFDDSTRGILPPRVTTAQMLAIRGLDSVIINSGGAGYSDGSNLSISGSTGAAATIIAPSGVITGVRINRSGYNIVGTPTLTPSTGTGASLTAVVRPPRGLYVFNIDSNAICVYNGTAWEKLGSVSPDSVVTASIHARNTIWKTLTVIDVNISAQAGILYNLSTSQDDDRVIDLTTAQTIDGAFVKFRLAGIADFSWQIGGSATVLDVTGTPVTSIPNNTFVGFTYSLSENTWYQEIYN